MRKKTKGSRFKGMLRPRVLQSFAKGARYYNERPSRHVWIGSLLGVVGALVFHVIFILLFPTMHVDTDKLQMRSSQFFAPELIDFAEQAQAVDAPGIDIPDPPDAIAAPQFPVIVEPDIAPDLTIPSTELVDLPYKRQAEASLRPPTVQRDSSALYRAHTALVAPKLTNRGAFVWRIERQINRLPQHVKDRINGVEVTLELYLDAEGNITKWLWLQKSGVDRVDRIIENSIGEMEYIPARFMDKKVPYPVHQTIKIRIR